MTTPTNQYEIRIPITLHRDSKIDLHKVQQMLNNDKTVGQLRDAIYSSLNADLPPKKEGKNFAKDVDFDLGTVEITPKPSLRSKAS
jgi:hypothetical protein